MLSTTESIIVESALPWLGAPLAIAVFFVFAGLTVIRRADARAGFATASAGMLVPVRAVLSVASTIVTMRIIDSGEVGAVAMWPTILRSGASTFLVALSAALTLYAALRLAHAISVADARKVN